MNLNLALLACTERRITAAGRAFGAQGGMGQGLAAAAAPPGALVKAQAS